MEYKTCTKCHSKLEIVNFGKRKKGKVKLNSICKKCENARQLNFYRTKKGLTNSIYSHEKECSKRRNHSFPNYSLCELREWAFSNLKFHILFDEWKNSGYAKNLIPSFDRINDNLPYSLDNMQIITWDENNKKANNDKLTGKLKTVIPRKKIKATSIVDGSILFFISTMDAERNGFCRSYIRKCCNGKMESYKGYYWQFEKEIILKELQKEIAKHNGNNT